MSDDADLLRRYARSHDEPAFGEFVARNITLVYSAAHRQSSGDAHLAEEITQQVFISAARRAGTLAEHPVIPAWLHQTARNAAIDLLRAQRSRRRREQEAGAMTEATTDVPTLNWEKISPELDRAVASLKQEDRDAVILRFFGNASFGEIGIRLGLSENAARMRVDRALDKLRVKLGPATGTAGALGLAALLAENSAIAVPAGLSASAAAAAFAAPLLSASSVLATAKVITAMKLTTAMVSIVALASIAAAVHEYQRANQAELALANAPRPTAPVATHAQVVASRPAAATAAPASAPAADSAPAKPANSRAAAFASMLAVLSNPAVQQQQSIMAKARLDAQYGPLFRALKLAPDQLDAFKNLIVEKQLAGFDTMSAAKEQGIDFTTNPKAMFQAVGAAENGVDGQISKLLGNDAFNQFQDYQQTIPARNTATMMQQALSYTDTPLTDAQQESLVKVLTQAGTPPLPQGNPFEVFNSDIGVIKLSDEGLAQVQAVLSPAQVQVLNAKVAQQAQLLQVRKSIAR